MEPGTLKSGDRYYRIKVGKGVDHDHEVGYFGTMLYQVQE